MGLSTATPRTIGQVDLILDRWIKLRSNFLECRSSHHSVARKFIPEKLSRSKGWSMAIQAAERRVKLWFIFCQWLMVEPLLELNLPSKIIVQTLDPLILKQQSKLSCVLSALKEELIALFIYQNGLIVHMSKCILMSNTLLTTFSCQMSAASNQEGGEGSDMDEPMASQGQVRTTSNMQNDNFDCLILASQGQVCKKVWKHSG